VLRACRPWIVWLIVLLLPLQGLAASGMWLCAALHGPGPVSAAGALDAAHADHAGHTGHAGHAGHGGHATDASELGPADDSARCSACAACCVGVGPVATLAVPSELEAARDVAAPPLATPGSALIAGPEKPPRSSRA
jgi:hypothetical protein